MSAVLELLDSTALIPFWARAHDAALEEPILGDTTALDMAAMVRQRFAEPPVPTITRVGCCLRNLAMDWWLCQLVERQQVETTVVIGAGLDTRRQRLPELNSRFVEVDSAAIIELRDRWIPAAGATRLAGDGLHVDTWLRTTNAAEPASVAIVLEGVLAYQQPERVARFLGDIREHLPGAYLLFDSPSPISARSANRPQPGREARPAYNWAPWSTSRLGDRKDRLMIIEEKGFMDFPRAMTSCFSRRDRIIHTLPLLRRSYRMTLARVPGGAGA
ncbi:class I SAM-dependent methyltransferase [Catenulispora rubra]|uniref:class I SAM-dependent methyltransferase n=1 Tax=Catenulispora rubra TaxID=280293 RepID=UPI001892526C|nr:class I SAM-dependent methyltransferase [Catenulispora rubra]